MLKVLYFYAIGKEHSPKYRYFYTGTAFNRCSTVVRKTARFLMEHLTRWGEKRLTKQS